jgi:hypothetical protein
MKMNKNPLNTSKDYNDNAETKRDKNSLARPNRDNEEYDTFSKGKASNIFQISQIDPHPLEVSANESPYN